MNSQFLNLLLEYIDAKINEFAANRFEDGGLSESVRVIELKQQLTELVSDET